MNIHSHLYSQPGNYNCFIWYCFTWSHMNKNKTILRSNLLQLLLNWYDDSNSLLLSIGNSALTTLNAHFVYMCSIQKIGNLVSEPGPCLNIKTVFLAMKIFIIQIKWSWDLLIFIMVIPILVRRYLYDETVPRTTCISIFIPRASAWYASIANSTWPIFAILVPLPLGI